MKIIDYIKSYFWQQYCWWLGGKKYRQYWRQQYKELYGK